MFFLCISYSANSQPSSYSQNNYSQQAAYGQQQQGYPAQQSSYSQQQGYPQQSQQQQAPPAYPPQSAGSYGQPPSSQYSQSGGPPNYNQSNHYSKPASLLVRVSIFSSLHVFSLKHCPAMILQIITDRMARGAVLGTLVPSQGIQGRGTVGVPAETGLIEVE